MCFQKHITFGQTKRIWSYQSCQSWGSTFTRSDLQTRIHLCAVEKILQNLTCNDWDVSGNAVRNNLDDSCFERNCDEQEEEEEEDDDDDDDDDEDDDCDSPIISQEEDDEDDEDTTVFFGPMGPKQEISGIQ